MSETAGDSMDGIRYCPKCKRELSPSDVDGYEFVCRHCDENFYSFETIVQHARHARDRDGLNTLEVECAHGKLVAGFFGDPDAGYNGIYIDLVKPDGKATQCCMAETVCDGTLHVLAWDGNHEEYVVEQEIDPDGEYVY